MKSPQTQIYIKESRKTYVLEICFIYIYIYIYIYICMDEWAGRQMDARKDKWMDGWVGGQMDRQIDR